METIQDKNRISVSAIINDTPEKVWNCWTNPIDIIHWNFASEDWCAPAAQNDLREAGKFSYRMEAKDGSVGFDFSGVYQKIIPYKLIEYILDDGRKVQIVFNKVESSALVNETFEAEDTNSLEQQQFGWQSILNNFKKYVESKNP
jgi:uncharacterized protein YndB with AHSA1/START domain